MSRPRVETELRPQRPSRRLRILHAARRGVASSSTCPVFVARDVSAPFLGFFLSGGVPPERKICRRGSVSRGLLEVGEDVAHGIVVGQAMGAEKDREGAMRIFVNTNGRLDEVRT
jgi:hypothetical protein